MKNYQTINKRKPRNYTLTITERAYYPDYVDEKDRRDEDCYIVIEDSKRKKRTKTEPYTEIYGRPVKKSPEIFYYEEEKFTPGMVFCEYYNSKKASRGNTSLNKIYNFIVGVQTNSITPLTLINNFFNCTPNNITPSGFIDGRLVSLTYNFSNLYKLLIYEVMEALKRNKEFIHCKKCDKLFVPLPGKSKVHCSEKCRPSNFRGAFYTKKSRLKKELKEGKISEEEFNELLTEYKIKKNYE